MNDPLRPVERRCICAEPVRVPGNENHSRECNLRHREMFFATVATARRIFKEVYGQ